MWTSINSSLPNDRTYVNVVTYDNSDIILALFDGAQFIDTDTGEVLNVSHWLKEEVEVTK